MSVGWFDHGLSAEGLTSKPEASCPVKENRHVRTG